MNRFSFPSLLDLTEFLDREFRMQYREAAELVQRPLQARVEQGVAIGDLNVVGHQRNGNGRPETVFETGSVASKFRTGDVVYCHRQDQPLDLPQAMQEFKQKPFRDRKIIRLSADRKQVILPGRYPGGGLWCLDQLPNERFPLTADPCLMAGVIEAEGAVGQKVQRWLSGDLAPFSVGRSRRGRRALTGTQRRALKRALEDEITIIQGPPGTGKTFLIAEIIEQLCSLDPTTRILVTCFSHTAIDNVLRAVEIRNPAIPQFRIGRREEDPALPPGVVVAGNRLVPGVAPGVWGMTAFKAAGPWISELRPGYREAANRIVGTVTVEQRAEMARIAWAAALPPVDEYFDVVIIDEASQMTLPNALMAMPHGKRCILVGDQKQLPPVAKTDATFAPSIFDHMLDSVESGREVMLDVTHRMNRDICQSASELFYGGVLQSSEDVQARRLDYPSLPDPNRDRPDWLRRALDPAEPILFLSTDHDTGEESSDEEAQCVAMIVAEMLAAGMSHEENLAVVSAHRRQNALVKRLTKQAVTEAFPEHELDVDGLVSDTVERIQGQQRDVIIVSLTGSDPDHLCLQWTFSHCPRRFNVAITRPKSKLLVVGSPKFFHFTPDTDLVKSLDRLAGTAALKRWYLDRLDRGQIAVVN